MTQCDPDDLAARDRLRVVEVHYEVNESGDIVAVVRDGVRETFNPSDFGWLKRGGANDVGNERRSLAQLGSIPGMTITVSQYEPREPGVRPKRSLGWQKWPDGSAPPALLMSKGGMEADHDGDLSTTAYFDRLTEAVGQIARNLPGAPSRSPMVVYDFVSGRRISVDYQPPAVAPGGRGTVYLLDDGFGIKIGWTSGGVAQRISGLQTGNPRTIIEVAAIADAGPDVESYLHGRLGGIHLTGEWYQRGQIIAGAAEHGSLGAWLRATLPPGERWDITVYPPYR